ncbi:hypothetical protein LXL04_034627 [Taraxacum kok-saghyz]
MEHVRGSRPIPGLVTSVAYTTKSALLFATYPKRYSIREVRGSRPIPGLVTSAAYTTKSALLFVVQVLIRSLLADRSSKTSLSTTSQLGPFRHFRTYFQFGFINDFVSGFRFCLNYGFCFNQVGSDLKQIFNIFGMAEKEMEYRVDGINDG